MARETESNQNITEREFGTDADVERLTGRKRRTLQKDRFFGRGFPYYRVSGQVLYDLNEVREIARAGRVDTTPSTHEQKCPNRMAARPHRKEKAPLVTTPEKS